MTSPISSEAQRKLYGWEYGQGDLKEHLSKLKIGLFLKKSRNLYNIKTHFLIFMFCMMTDRPTVKVSYTLDA